ncbi:patatin-like phospholipase family protein [Sporocytophaga myxococcoides]|uniref:patatin-like phospholipase family protein n=1 Tax=Sporocytophaga myxococcoides TaxID=153721 RepID=UPI0004202A8B|nr:patatin-like phospholipase family protein [Sporocytophaga myxococcoides]
MRVVLFLILLITISQYSTGQTQIENLVFEGAGIRGIAYSGAIYELEKAGITSNIKKVGGTSAGAITALMLSLGYTSSEIYEIISSTKFQSFNDGKFIFIGGIYRMNNSFGWYQSDTFNKWLEKIISKKTGNADITFSDLKKNGFKDLYVTGTCLNKQQLLVFSVETYPSMKIKDAVRASMSIPLYFEAVFIDNIGNSYKNKKSGKNLDIVVDGGITGNFPIFLFDTYANDSLQGKIRIPNNKTLGFRIDSDAQIISDSINHNLATLEINNTIDYLSAFYIYSIESLNRIPLIPQDWERTVSVSSAGINPRVRKLSEKELKTLIKSGENATAKFLSGKNK